MDYTFETFLEAFPWLNQLSSALSIVSGSPLIVVAFSELFDVEVAKLNFRTCDILSNVDMIELHSLYM
jgi:hypothetical protein